jgi:hypothetical protein
MMPDMKKSEWRKTMMDCGENCNFFQITIHLLGFSMLWFGSEISSKIANGMFVSL